MELKKTAPRKQRRRQQDNEGKEEEDATVADNDEHAVPDAADVEVVGDGGDVVANLHVIGAGHARGGAGEEPAVCVQLDGGVAAVVVELRRASVREAVKSLQTIMCENLLGVQRDQLPATAAGQLWAVASAFAAQWLALGTPDGTSTKAMVDIVTLLVATTHLLLAVCSCMKSIDGIALPDDNIRCLLKDTRTSCDAVLSQFLADGGVSAEATSLPSVQPALSQSSKATDDEAIVLNALQLLLQKELSPSGSAQLLDVLSTLPCDSAAVVTDATLEMEQEKEETKSKREKEEKVEEAEEEEEAKETVVDNEDGKKEEIGKEDEEKEKQQDKKGKRKQKDDSKTTALDAAVAALKCFFTKVKLHKILLEVTKQVWVRACYLIVCMHETTESCLRSCVCLCGFGDAGLCVNRRH